MTIGRIPNIQGGIQPTIIDAAGDLITGVSNDTPARLAVGANDQVLVADSTQSTGLAWKSYGAQVMAGKNAVINGAFDIWQRGTSLTPGVTLFNSYQADRWSTYAAANWTVSRQATGDTTNLPNIQYCARYQRNSGNTATTVLQTQNVFETVNSIPLTGKTVTLSFYARAGANYSATSNVLNMYVYTGTSTDANISGFTGTATPVTINATLTTSWQRFTATGTIATNTTQIAVYGGYTPTGTAGANDYFEITGVQLELGSTATPFSRAGGTIQGELAACQRYYWRISGVTANPTFVGIGYAGSGSTTHFYPFIKLAQTMRVAPTSIDYANLAWWASAGTTAASSAVINNATYDTVGLDVTTTGLTASTVVLLAFNNTAGYLGMSAEL